MNQTEYFEIYSKINNYFSDNGLHLLNKNKLTQINEFIHLLKQIKN